MENRPETEEKKMEEGGMILSDEKAMAALEAILFAMGEAVELERLSAAVELEKKKVRELLCALRLRYQEEGHGLELLELDHSWQLCTKKENFEYLIRIAKQPRKISLTDVMMETLSIVAYKQPVTKLEIEKIRGVKSDHAVNRLVEYNLVREIGRLDAPGRPILFGTTEDFLRHFGLSSLEELPEMDRVQLEDFKAEAEEEIGKGEEK